MIKKLPALVLVLAVLAYAGTVVATQSLTGFTQLIGISTDANTVKMDATTNRVKQDTLQSAILHTTVASTTAVAFTALTGRDYLEIRSGQTAGEEIWVGIATAPVVGTGICVTKESPLKLTLDDGVVVKTIASGAFSMSVFQAKY